MEKCFYCGTRKNVELAFRYLRSDDPKETPATHTYVCSDGTCKQKMIDRREKMMHNNEYKVLFDEVSKPNEIL